MESLLIVIFDLHHEVDWNMLAKAFLSFHASLDALESTPLAGGGFLFHHADELCLVDDLHQRSNLLVIKFRLVILALAIG